jgi:hypothetical protein
MIRIKTGKPRDLYPGDSPNRKHNSRNNRLPRAQFTNTPTIHQARRVPEAEMQDGFVLDEDSQPN